MVMKKQAVKAAPKNDDSVVYKVMVALLIACLECLVIKNSQQIVSLFLQLAQEPFILQGVSNGNR